MQMAKADVSIARPMDMSVLTETSSEPWSTGLYSANASLVRYDARSHSVEETRASETPASATVVCARRPASVSQRTVGIWSTERMYVNASTTAPTPAATMTGTATSMPESTEVNAESSMMLATST